MICSNCGYVNDDGVTICIRCGALLVDPSNTTIIKDNGDDEGMPKYGSVRFANQLLIKVLEGSAEFAFDREDLDELVIGREDPDTGEVPPIDLSSENALELGVSRNHAVIVRRDGALHIRDNNSSNGTFLNGQRLIHNQLRVLRDGDDIRVGKLILRISFQ